MTKLIILAMLVLNFSTSAFAASNEYYCEGNDGFTAKIVPNGSATGTSTTTVHFFQKTKVFISNYSGSATRIGSYIASSLANTATGTIEGYMKVNFVNSPGASPDIFASLYLGGKQHELSCHEISSFTLQSLADNGCPKICCARCR